MLSAYSVDALLPSVYGFVERRSLFFFSADLCTCHSLVAITAADSLARRESCGL